MAQQLAFSVIGTLTTLLNRPCLVHNRKNVTFYFAILRLMQEQKKLLTGTVCIQTVNLKKKVNMYRLIN